MTTMSALLAAAMLAAATPAAAGHTTVRHADLNLAHADGIATLHRRIEVAARQLCGNGARDLAIARHQTACRADALAHARATAERVTSERVAAAQATMLLANAGR